MSKKKENEFVRLAAVEGGGTSFRVVVFEILNEEDGNNNGDDWWSVGGNGMKQQQVKLVAQDIIDSSSSPQQTLDSCCAFFRQWKQPEQRGYGALGIAMFGPVGLNPNDPETFGRILGSSPKASWRNVNFLEPLRRACSSSSSSSNDDGGPLVPVWLETDVNAPAMMEYLRAVGAKDKISSCAYITVGTGVGVGLVVNGQTVHGTMHPEGGHVPVQPLPGDSFPGYSWGKDTCPFRGVHTVEGIASSVALTERLLENNSNNNSNRSILADLPDDHEVFDHAANALANLCVTLLLLTSMEKIVLGGGLLNRSGLLAKIQQRTVQLLNGYLPHLPQENMNQLIGLSESGKDAGLHGAMVLAQQAWQRAKQQQQPSSQPPTTTSPNKEEEDALRVIKQEAFQVGLWQGILVGAVGMAGLLQWLWFGKRRRPH